MLAQLRTLIRQRSERRCQTIDVVRVQRNHVTFARGQLIFNIPEYPRHVSIGYRPDDESTDECLPFVQRRRTALSLVIHLLFRSGTSSTRLICIQILCRLRSQHRQVIELVLHQRCVNRSHVNRFNVHGFDGHACRGVALRLNLRQIRLPTRSHARGPCSRRSRLSH